MNLNRLKLIFLILTTILISTTNVLAQSDYEPLPDPVSGQSNYEINSDRPFFTQSPFTVPNGFFQLEGGFGRARLSVPGADFTVNSFPDLLVRYGLSNSVELRAGWSFISTEFSNSYFGYRSSGSSTGTTDLYLGLKIGLTSNSPDQTNTAFILNLKAPTGSSRNDDFAGGFGLLYKSYSNNGSYLSGSTEILSESSKAVRFIVSQSVTINVALGEKLSIFIEPAILYYVTSANYKSQGDYFYNSGLTFNANDDLQLSLTFGQEVDSFFGTNYFASIGVAYRS